MIPQLILLALLVGLSAFFSASETAFTSVNKIRLKYKAENGSTSAGRCLLILEQYDRALSTILVGNNIVNITMSSIATVMALTLLPPEIAEKYGAVISTVCVTIVVITFGEILPKTIVRVNPEAYCIAVSSVMHLLMKIFTPITAAFLLLQRWATGIFSKGEKSVSVTEEELMQFIEDIEDEGVLEEQESSLVRSALAFDETTVSEILTPRVNIVAISINDDVERVRDLFFTEGYSRLPVYDKTIDHISGILNTKDFMRELANSTNFAIRDVMQETLFVPELMKIPDVLRLMQKEKLHLAVVVDQYGGTKGIVTLEDILEELVGEIWDENDEIMTPVVFTADDMFEVSGHLAISDFNRYFEQQDMDYEIVADCNTVGGWVLELFGLIPEEAAVVRTPDFVITVLEISDRRIGRLSFKII